MINKKQMRTEAGRNVILGMMHVTTIREMTLIRNHANFLIRTWKKAGYKLCPEET